jgi:hypothetical protein
MRACHVRSVLAPLLLLWLGVAAAQKATSWKTLSGALLPSAPSSFLSGLMMSLWGRRQFVFVLHKKILFCARPFCF